MFTDDIHIAIVVVVASPLQEIACIFSSILVRFSGRGTGWLSLEVARSPMTDEKGEDNNPARPRRGGGGGVTCCCSMDLESINIMTRAVLCGWWEWRGDLASRMPDLDINTSNGQDCIRSADHQQLTRSSPKKHKCFRVRRRAPAPKNWQIRLRE